MRQTGVAVPPEACDGNTLKFCPVRVHPAIRPLSSASMSPASELMK